MYTLKYNNVTIGKYKHTDEVWEALREYTEKELKFKTYYYQVNYLTLGKPDVMIDYGDHNNFFYMIKDESEENENDI